MSCQRISCYRLASLALVLIFGAAANHSPANAQTVSVPVGAVSLNALGLKLNLEGPAKVIVTAVDPAGVAAKAGVEVGDQIVSVGNAPVDDVAEIDARLAAQNPSEPIEFSFYRKNRAFDVQLTLVAPTKTEAAAVATNPKPGVAVPVDIYGMELKEVVPGVIGVSSVVPGSPAAAAGVMPADVLLSIAGHRAAPLSELLPFATDLVRNRPGSDPVQLQVSRADVPLRLDVFAGKAAEPAPAPLPDQSVVTLLGLVLRDTSPNTVSVISVAPGGPADVAGLQPSDILRRVDQKPVTTSAQFAALVAVHCVGDLLELRLERGGVAMPAKLPLAPRMLELTKYTLGDNGASKSQEVEALRRQVELLSGRVQDMQARLDAGVRPVAVPPVIVPAVP